MYNNTMNIYTGKFTTAKVVRCTFSINIFSYLHFVKNMGSEL